ncbi:TonB-dependent receptor plug domain-containing protein [Uliginosibacterium gangwonense]|uniref:TonB-dependent receptor plug domain-containing protein n=1 Tax=Uliginosibacterium gangwonense TaxID=392736 RepID=UPI0012FBD505|nr:TonB-dependent receptor [Uliginosibacterium gangwonense]
MVTVPPARLSCLALALMSAAINARAADSEDASRDTQATQLSNVVVTGSRIPRTEKEGPTGVTVVTGKELESMGYTNVFDALAQQTQNTGFTQGADFGNTFTPAANTISLRGLGPNHTLVLVNGHRVSEYPVAYDGTVNFVNLANIPSAMIDRVEILNGGASAIYGSDAIAGVVNIVLKKQLSGIDVNVKLGGTEHGGGGNGRLQLVGGANYDKFSAVFGLELSRRDPIWSRQRGFMSDTTLEGANPTSVWSRRDLDTGRYVGADSVCGGLAGNFDGSVRPWKSKSGVYCASGKASPSYWTTQTKNDSQNAYAGLNYELSDAATLFADLMVGFNSTQNNTRGPTWTSDAAGAGYFLNQSTGHYEVWSRRFAPEEIGSAERFNRVWNDQSATVNLGVRGKVPSSTWNYEAAYSASAYESRNTVSRLRSSIDQFYLGDKLGVDADGISIYNPNTANFNRSLTPAEFDSLVGQTTSHDRAWTQTLALSGTGELFELPSGPLKLAGVLEVGSQGYGTHPDPALNEGVFYNVKPVQNAGGNRSRFAAGVELAVPITKQLSGTLAGRYDDYSFAGRSDGKFTYGTGLEYRPTRSLLLRSNYATSFRAPDMNYVYSATTRGYYSSSTDYYLCQKAGQPLSNCDYANVSPGYNYTQVGSKDLKSENGTSFGYGLVFAPSANYDASIDYWNIKIKDLVTNLDPDVLLRTEADCRSGVKDIHSAECVDAISRITRNPSNSPNNPDAVTNIAVNPINAASERTSGIDISGKLRWSIPQVGSFQFRVAYTRVLTHKYRQFANDPETDLLRSLSNMDWSNKTITSLTWANGPWGTTLDVTRYGKVPNADQSGYTTPLALANLSVAYRFTKQTAVSVIVNNLLDTVKKDSSGGWPFYPVGNYNPYGRQAWLTLESHFGS